MKWNLGTCSDLRKPQLEERDTLYVLCLFQRYEGSYCQLMPIEGQIIFPNRIRTSATCHGESLKLDIIRRALLNFRHTLKEHCDDVGKYLFEYCSCINPYPQNVGFIRNTSLLSKFEYLNDFVDKSNGKQSTSPNLTL